MRIFSIRPPDVAPNRQALNALLLCVLPAILVHYDILPLWLILWTMGLLVWRYLIENHGWSMPGKLLKSVLVMLALIAVFRQFNTIFGREPGVSLLTILTALKLLELKKQRDYAITIILVCFLSISLFLFNQEMWTVIYVFGITLFCIACFALSAQPTPYSWRLDIKNSTFLLLKAIPLMLLCYFLFPRIQGSLWAVPGAQNKGVTGFTDTVKPGSISQLIRDDRLAFRVEFDQAQPQYSQMYWRVKVLTKSDGRQWNRTGNNLFTRQVTYTLPSNKSAFAYRITMQPHEKKWLPVLELPSALPHGSSVNRMAEVEIVTPLMTTKSYDFRSITGLSLTDSLDRKIPFRYKPSVFPVSQRVRALVDNFKSVAGDDAALINAMRDYFRLTPFTYTLQPPLIDGDFLDNFLFDYQRGFCEHFASAFSLLAQLAGIPSRVVVGYLGGEYNDNGDYLMVRQSDAHAWSEVWLADTGWIRVDPTALIAPERIELGVDAIVQLERQGFTAGSLDTARILDVMNQVPWLESFWHRSELYWDSVNHLWAKLVLNYTPERQRNFFRWLGFDSPNWTHMILVLTSLFTLLLCITGIVLLKRTDKADPIRRYYDEFQKKMCRAGLPLVSSEGPIDFAQRSCECIPDKANAIREITDLYVQLRYGEVDDDRMKMSLKNAIRDFRA